MQRSNSPSSIFQILRRLFIVLYLASYSLIALNAYFVAKDSRPHQVIDRSSSYVICPWGNITFEAAGFSGIGLTTSNERVSSYDQEKATRACAGSDLIRGYHFEFNTIGSVHEVVKKFFITFSVGVMVVEIFFTSFLYIVNGKRLSQQKTLLGRVLSAI